jgi:hypothetical protein
MRLILRLHYPAGGTVTVNGKPHSQLPSPMREVRALLDARAVHGAWYADVVRWLPGGDVVVAITGTQSENNPHLFSAWGEFAVFGADAVILLIIGAVLFHRRDA